MKKWLLLATAISGEVGASLSLKAALDHPGWYVTVVAGYATGFVFLTLVLRAGLPLGIAYGIWGACGVALTAVASTALFGEPLTALMGVGIAVVVAGVLLVELGSTAHPRAQTPTQTPAQTLGAEPGRPRRQEAL